MHTKCAPGSKRSPSPTPPLSACHSTPRSRLRARAAAGCREQLSTFSTPLRKPLPQFLAANIQRQRQSVPLLPCPIYPAALPETVLSLRKFLFSPPSIPLLSNSISAVVVPLPLQRNVTPAPGRASSSPASFSIWSAWCMTLLAPVARPDARVGKNRRQGHHGHVMVRIRRRAGKGITGM